MALQPHATFLTPEHHLRTPQDSPQDACMFSMAEVLWLECIVGLQAPNGFVL